MKDCVLGCATTASQSTMITAMALVISQYPSPTAK